jgi:hypothetical protein
MRSTGASRCENYSEWTPADQRVVPIIRTSMTMTEAGIPRGRAMPNLHIPWPPYIGDRVGIKGSGLRGTVERIDGMGDAQRFVLSVFAPAVADAHAASALTEAARSARTTYLLSELEPYP